MKFILKNTKLHTRIFILISGIVLCLVLIFSGHNWHNLRKQRYKEFLESGKVAIQNFASNSLSGILTEDAFLLETAVQILFDRENISYAYIYDQENMLIYNINVEPGLERFMRGEKVDKIQVEQVEIGRKAIPTLDLLAPVFDSGGAYIGSVRVGVSLESIKAEERDIFISSMILVLISLSLGFVVSFIFSRSMSEPIEEIIDIMSEIIASNDLSKRITMSMDIVEINKLKDNFNHMLKELDDGRKQLVENVRMKRELEIASIIQTSLLPHVHSQYKGYDIYAKMFPAAEVGGDYFDIVKGSDSRLWLGIGDVSGHGVTSGLIMMMTETAAVAHIKAVPNLTPKQLIIEVNKTLYENINLRLKTEHYVTLSYFSADEQGNFKYAGMHAPIIIYRSKTQKCEIINEKGFWVGIMSDLKDNTYEDKLKLESGDALVLYTDGIIEAKNKSREDFEQERFIAAIEASSNKDKSAKDIGAQIIDTVRDFMEGNEAEDDMTLLIIKKI